MALTEQQTQALKSLQYSAPEAKAPVAPQYTESLADLESDPVYQKDAETYLEWLSENTTGWKKFLDAGSWFGNDDIFETLRDEDMRLGTISARASQMKEAPKNVRQAYARLRTRFDKADTRYSDQFLGAVGNIATDVVADPINIITGLFTGGAGVGATVAGKQGVTQTLKRLAVSNTKGEQATKGALVGSLYGGADSYYRQNTELAAGLRNAVSSEEIAGTAAAGALLGGAAGYLFGVSSPGKYRRETLDLASSEDHLSNSKKVDIDPDTLKTTTDFANSATARIQSEDFIDLDPSQWESYFDDIIDDVVSSVKGGETTKGELRDAVRRTIAENQGATGEKIASELRFKAAQVLHGTIPKVTLVGKPAGILSAYTAFSNTAKELQKKFRYDLGRTLRGKREIEDPDFFEEMNFMRGSRITRMKEALEPVLLNAKGAAYDELNDGIVTLLRGGTVEDVSDSVVKAADNIRQILDEVGNDLVGYGIMDEPLTDYFPRMWDRSAIEKNIGEFRELLIKDGVATKESVNDLVEELLDKKNQVDVGGTTRSFFAKRKLNITDDSSFDKFLDNDINSVLVGYLNQTSKSIAKSKVFGVQNIDDFKNIWLDPLVNELKQAGKSLDGNRREEILNIYRTATGEGISKFNDTLQTGVDYYVLGTRLALLPLATLSSVTEIAINMSKAGFVNSIKGFGEATEIAFKSVGPDMISRLTGKGKLTKSEAFKELNSVMLAMDQAVADGAERLSGDALSTNLQRKINNGFFKLNFLDQWTKFVQLTSFTTAKELINDNLTKIAAVGSSPTRRTQNQMDQLTELGLDINKGLEWLKAGASKEDDFYKKDILRAAARYTNEVILNPSPEAGLKPNIMSNPKTSILFQLLGYPSAFTNVILKRFITDSIRDPVGNIPKIGGTAILMTEMARLSNYARSHGESEKNKTPSEARLEAISRWGGNGMILDMYERGKDASKYNQSAVAFFSGFGGPVFGDAYKVIRQDRPASVIGSKVPGYAAIKPILGEDVKENYDRSLNEIDKQIKELIPERDKKLKLYTGGEVFDVPNVPTEPDERIDKMTGRPYDQQAGAAFVDAEDPLRRLGFKGGGEVDPLKRLGFGVGGAIARTIRQFAPSYVKDSNIEEAAAFLQNQGVTDEAADLLRIEANIKGTDALSPENVDVKIDTELERIGARQNPRESFVEATGQARAAEDPRSDISDDDLIFMDDDELSESLQRIEAFPAEKEMEFRSELDFLQSSSDPMEREAANMLNRMLVKMPRTRDPEIQDDVEEDLPQRVKEYVQNSVVKEPVYRATGHGVVTDYEINFALPREIGPHFGTKGQANYVTLNDYYNVNELNYKQNELGMTQEQIFESGLVKKPGRIPAMTKGYLNIKNPVVIEKDLGVWDAGEILEDLFKIKDKNTKVFMDSIFKQSKNRKEAEGKFYDFMRPTYLRYQDFKALNEGKEDTALYKLQENIRTYDINIKLKEFLKSLGFDGLKYRNTIEGSAEELSEKDGVKGEYSYIAFDPQQFKVVTAARFDPEDPRAFRAEGGYV